MNNDLISRSALLEKAEYTDNYRLIVPVDCIEKAPAVDAETVFEQIGLVKDAFEIAKASLVPVVRCKDCRYLYDGVDDYCCSRHAGLVKNKPDSFCSYGERKADGEA